jgi:hypothetical protein
VQYFVSDIVEPQWHIMRIVGVPDDRPGWHHCSCRHNVIPNFGSWISELKVFLWAYDMFLWACDKHLVLLLGRETHLAKKSDISAPKIH